MTANDLKYADLLRQRKMDEHTRSIQKAELALKQEAQPYSLAHTQAQTDVAIETAKKASEDAALSNAKRAEIYSKDPSTYAYAIHGGSFDEQERNANANLAYGIWGFDQAVKYVGNALGNLTGVVGKAVKAGLGLDGVFNK